MREFSDVGAFISLYDLLILHLNTPCKKVSCPSVIFVSNSKNNAVTVYVAAFDAGMRYRHCTKLFCRLCHILQINVFYLNVSQEVCLYLIYDVLLVKRVGHVWQSIENLEKIQWDLKHDEQRYCRALY